uniref:C2H2-type domain-containing protein n=1 Tax=Cyprinodon variegatus TaxID=28743 RepID=A0A3Q2DQG0_CYPVA
MLKPFSCPECGKGFWRKFEQNRHVLTHRKDRPYACTFCSKSYTRRNHLNRHLLTHQEVDVCMLHKQKSLRMRPEDISSCRFSGNEPLDTAGCG